MLAEVILEYDCARRARAVADPVSLYAQIVNANADMAVPRREIACPTQTIVKANMPFGCLDSISVNDRFKLEILYLSVASLIKQFSGEDIPKLLY